MKLFDKIFKNSSIDKFDDLTTITRTETLDGFSIPAIILNLQYHFTDLQVYSDGLVYCWEMVDLPLFKDKLNKNWVVTSIPDGKNISILSLGSWTIDQGEWQYSKEDFYNYIHSLIRRLNPKLENLYNCYGTTTIQNGKVNVSKHKMPNPKPYYISKPNVGFPKRTNGVRFYIFFKNDDDKTYLVELSIFQDGHVELTNLPEKKFFEFTDLRSLIENRILTTNPTLGERINILGLGSFVIKSGQGVNIESKYNEFVDKYNELIGKEGSIEKCRRIFEEYKKVPTIKLKKELKDSYEAVPEHQRIFVGNMDTKDFEVRLIIYGDKVKKEWEEDYGYEFPDFDIPKPIDE